MSVLRRTPAAVFALLAAVGAPGADWPAFLGPNANNTSPETGLLDRWPDEGPKLNWEKMIGTGYSAPSIIPGTLVLHHRIRDEEVVEALDAATGERQWRFAYPSQFRDPFGYNNGPRATPLLTTNRCFTFGAEGMLTCLSLDDGHVIWQRNTAKDWQVPEAFFGVGSSPVLEGGKLIVMIGGQPNAGVAALDPETGRTIWESVGRDTWDGVTPIGWRTTKPYSWTGSEMLASYSTPIAATIHGQRHLLCLMRQGLVSLDPNNGQLRFQRWFSAQVNESVNAMTPVVHDDTVLISAAYYRVGAAALRVRADGNSYEELWRSPQNPFERDAATGDYPEPVLELHFSTPVLVDGYLYAFSGRNEPDATFRCVEMKTGRLMWNRDQSWPARSGGQPAVFGRGAAILADGKLIALGEGGRLGLFKPNLTKPEQLCVWQVPQLHYPCWTGPVLSNRRLYLRSEDRLICFDFSKPAG